MYSILVVKIAEEELPILTESPDLPEPIPVIVATVRATQEWIDRYCSLNNTGPVQPYWKPLNLHNSIR